MLKLGQFVVLFSTTTWPSLSLWRQIFDRQRPFYCFSRGSTYDHFCGQFAPVWGGWLAQVAKISKKKKFFLWNMTHVSRLVFLLPEPTNPPPPSEDRDYDLRDTKLATSHLPKMIYTTSRKRNIVISLRFWLISTFVSHLTHCGW